MAGSERIENDGFVVWRISFFSVLSVWRGRERGGGGLEGRGGRGRGKGGEIPFGAQISSAVIASHS